MAKFSHLNQTQYSRELRRRRDVPTGGHLICPGSFFPFRPAVIVDGRCIHTVEIKKRNAYHATCDICGIQFTLNHTLWKNFKVLPKFSGSDTVIPGLSLSEAEARVLLPILTEAKIRAQDEWKEQVWQTLSQTLDSQDLEGPTVEMRDSSLLADEEE